MRSVPHVAFAHDSHYVTPVVNRSGDDNIPELMSDASLERGIALVIGLSIHGLAVARALAHRGIDVHALAQPARWRSAPTYTRYARVHFAEDLNSDQLVVHLQALARTIPGSTPIVLFPTSDRMVGAIARGWRELSQRYALSWAHCRDLVAHMQRKDSLPELAERARVLHPRSQFVRGVESCESALAGLSLPVIVKPVQPLSRFKAFMVGSETELRGLVERYPADLPFIVQQFVDGGEDSLFACTTYLDHGRELCVFTSRKLAADPPGLGQGTVFVAEDIPELRDLTRQFLWGLDLSGPIALEFKRDSAGRYWMIEANVGRTEYCVDLVIQSGVDLPGIEYRHALGLAEDPRSNSPSYAPRGWFDTDKDPLCYLKYRRQVYEKARPGAPPVFPYAGSRDVIPWIVSSIEQSLRLTRETSSLLRLTKSVHSQPSVRSRN